jgi:hypothetical protein
MGYASDGEDLYESRRKKGGKTSSIGKEGRREGGREGGREAYKGDAVHALVLEALMDDARVPHALLLVFSVDEDLREGWREGGMEGGREGGREPGDGERDEV